MNENSNASCTEEAPIRILLRQHRLELRLTQAQIAEALHVSPECVTHWESGRRRMELSKLPGLAAALHLDPKELCVKALAEFHPAFCAVLFDRSTADPVRQQAAA